MKPLKQSFFGNASNTHPSISVFFSSQPKTIQLSLHKKECHLALLIKYQSILFG